MNDVLSKNLSVAERLANDLGLGVDSFDNDVLIVVDDYYLNLNFENIFVDNYNGSSSSDPDEVWGECQDTIVREIEYLFETDEELINLVKRIKSDPEFVEQSGKDSFGVELSMGNYNEDVLVEKLVERVEG